MILVIVLALFAVAATAVTTLLLVKRFMENEQRKKLLELKLHAKQVMMPLRLQAYERMAMFLERIEPNSLLYRVDHALTAYQMQTILLATIRSEYEHNLSQQVYLSVELWDAIRLAKEQVVNVINLAAGKLPESATAADLTVNVLEMVAEQSPIAQAMLQLKKEVAEFY